MSNKILYRLWNCSKFEAFYYAVGFLESNFVPTSHIFFVVQENILVLTLMVKAALHFYYDLLLVAVGGTNNCLESKQFG